MPKRNNTVLKLSHFLYDSRCIETAVREFSDSVEVAVTKDRDATEVSIMDDSDGNILSEFANYVLFLTIQSR
ncbi:MAG: HxsD-like protein [Candidatus Moraniibacteriota bacterium]